MLAGEDPLRRTLFALVLASVAACTVGPDYRRPDLAVSPTWSRPASADLSQSAGATDTATGEPSQATTTPEPQRDLAQWWKRFADSTLTSLVERAVKSNVDVEVAEARVRQAVASRRIASSQLWPSLDASAATSAGTGADNSTLLASAGYLLDLFGGVRRSVEAADADIQASIEERHAVLLALVGEVASTYIELRGSQSAIATLRQNLATQQETWDLTKARRSVGLASDLDVERARAQAAGTSAALSPLESIREQSVHRLGVLLGGQPAALTGELRAQAAIPSAPSQILVGVPADLLRRRPDLRRAERELAAATARVGAATADLYPRFTLTGSVGLASASLDDLLKSGSRLTTLSPSIVWPVFAGGAIRGAIRVRDAQQEEALARYEATLLAALEDVENAFVRHTREQLRRRDLEEAVDANREAAELARRLYSNGLVGFLDVLVAERSLVESESRLVDSQTAVSTTLVAIYVALGGGWEEAEEVRLQ
ncbi:MAG: efflux transporter outer membrane subunit [Deltaproteobacteria bacterium]|nr:efflux transporter outer membrane subunit [Deltaproteobacteria bacterium]